MKLIFIAEFTHLFCNIPTCNHKDVCYYNLQMRCQDVKQMIFQKWQVQNSDNSDSVTDKDTITADLLWVICGNDSESERRVLPVMTEIRRRLRNMGLTHFSLFICLEIP